MQHKLACLIASPSKCWLEGEGGANCHFTSDGFTIVDSRNAVVKYEWGNVWGLIARGPSHTSAIKGLWLLDLLTPGNLREPYLFVHVSAMSRQVTYRLGKPQGAPFPYPALDAQEAIFERLQDLGKLPLLGSSQFMYELLGLVNGRQSWLTPLTYSRVKRAIDSVLGAST